MNGGIYQTWSRQLVRGQGHQTLISRLCTLDLRDTWQLGLFTNRKGRLVAWALIRTQASTTELLGPNTMIETLHTYLNGMAFLEELIFEDGEEQVVSFYLASVSEENPDIRFSNQDGEHLYLRLETFDASPTTTTSSITAFTEQCAERGFPQYIFNWPMDSHPLEMGLEAFIDWNKGCFPGQETLSRQQLKGRTSDRRLFSAEVS